MNLYKYTKGLPEDEAALLVKIRDLLHGLDSDFLKTIYEQLKKLIDQENERKQ